VSPVGTSASPRTHTANGSPIAFDTGSASLGLAVESLAEGADEGRPLRAQDCCYAFWVGLSSSPNEGRVTP